MDKNKYNFLKEYEFCNKKFKYYFDVVEEEYIKVEYRPEITEKEYKEVLTIFITDKTVEDMEQHNLGDIVKLSIEGINDNLLVDKVMLAKIVDDEQKLINYISSYILGNKNKKVVEIVLQSWFLYNNKIHYIQYAKITNINDFQSGFVEKYHTDKDIKKIVESFQNIKY